MLESTKQMVQMKAQSNVLVFKVEHREAAQIVHGTILQEGRAASVRNEVFSPGSVSFPQSGIRILSEHRGRDLATAFPQRGADGSITVDIPASEGVLSAVRERPYLSVEFYALAEKRTKGGIREIRKAFVDAAAFVKTPEYEQATTEIREQDTLRWL